MPLITTDGFQYYGPAVSRVFSNYCVYGQVIKTQRKNPVVRVERRLVVGTKEGLPSALVRSEDSHTLNTCFVERLNLRIRAATCWATPSDRRSSRARSS